MTDKAYDFAVFIGRFQPFHNGHLKVIEEGLKIAEKVLVLVGSSNAARSIRNPFTALERSSMIRNAVHGCNMVDGHMGIHFLPDSTYNDLAWMNHVLNIVDVATAGRVSPRITLIGNERDASSYYLRLFPGWTYTAVEDHQAIHATSLRNDYFAGGNVHEKIAAFVPSFTMDYLSRWRDQHEYRRLMDAQKFYAEYQDKWGKGPFVTADSVVLHGNKVLLIERGDGHDAGLYALPGGFLNLDETLLRGAVRELREETGLVVYGGPLASQTYDDPHRSPRGRIITTAFLFDVSSVGPLPPIVTGADDAKKAEWVSIADLCMEMMFEDHGFIVRDLLRKRNAT